jgi:hypothetical protein
MTAACNASPELQNFKAVANQPPILGFVGKAAMDVRTQRYRVVSSELTPPEPMKIRILHAFFASLRAKNIHEFVIA